MNTREASSYLAEQHNQRLAPLTLANLRCAGGGPVIRRVGRSVVYDRADLDAWAINRISPPMKSTRESATITEAA